MIEIEKIILDQNPDVVISQGDTNTVLASALATRKLNKCFMHLNNFGSSLTFVIL